MADGYLIEIGLPEETGVWEKVELKLSYSVDVEELVDLTRTLREIHGRNNVATSLSGMRNAPVIRVIAPTWNAVRDEVLDWMTDQAPDVDVFIEEKRITTVPSVRRRKSSPLVAVPFPEGSATMPLDGQEE